MAEGSGRPDSSRVLEAPPYTPLSQVDFLTPQAAHGPLSGPEARLLALCRGALGPPSCTSWSPAVQPASWVWCMALCCRDSASVAAVENAPALGWGGEEEVPWCF